MQTKKGGENSYEAKNSTFSIFIHFLFVCNLIDFWCKKKTLNYAESSKQYNIEKELFLTNKKIVFNLGMLASFQKSYIRDR